MLEAILARNPTEKLYVEDVFQTYLYSGTGSSQTITNGIDLAGKGGMVWIKSRSHSGASGHVIHDTVRGAGNLITPSGNGGSILGTKESYFTGSGTNDFYAFTSSGFSLGGDTYFYKNTTGQTYVSWSFRKAPKFFDVVTFTTNSAGGATFSHALGTTPGFVIVKATSTTSNWVCFHRSLGSNYALLLNGTNAQISQPAGTYSASSSSVTFIDGTFSFPSSSCVAYLFAHDTTADGIVQCGSFTGSNNVDITLGWEPQFLLVKPLDATGNWYTFDNMRGVATEGNDAILYSNTSDVESVSADRIDFTATGFRAKNAMNSGNVGGISYIYLAIRRGPMRTPTDATKVFGLNARTGSGVSSLVDTGVNTDLAIVSARNVAHTVQFVDRLRGYFGLSSTSTGAEADRSAEFSTSPFDNQTGFDVTGVNSNSNSSSYNYINYGLGRAPGFFDIVCYTGTGSARTVSHNLGVAPELIIVKKRNTVYDWCVWHKDLTNTQYNLYLNTTLQSTQSQEFTTNSATPTATTFPVQQGGFLNSNGDTYVAYLFATCSGVSKVGSYTGNDSSLNIDCGFTNGARFVLIKRTDSPGGNWYVWDTARGIVSANDPHLSLNSTAAEVTTNDSIDPLSTGFTVNQVAATNVNVNAASYIYLAIA